MKKRRHSENLQNLSRYIHWPFSSELLCAYLSCLISKIVNIFKKEAKYRDENDEYCRECLYSSETKTTGRWSNIDADLCLIENEDTKMVVAPTSGNIVVFGAQWGCGTAFHIYKHKETGKSWKLLVGCVNIQIMLIYSQQRSRDMII